MPELAPNERLDAVNDRLRLIQKTDGLTFGTDALLLASFIDKKGKTALELGGGSGIISMLLAARARFSHITCAEIQEDYASLIRRNISLNQLEEKITVCHTDIRIHGAMGFLGSYDAVFSNPPYMTASSGLPCDNDAKNIARHEMNGTVEDFVKAAAAMLKYGGIFYVVYRTERLTDMLCACRENKLEPKRLTMVHGRKSLPPSMFLLECRLGGKCGLTVTRPLILSSDAGNSADYDYLLENGILPEGF